ncbi:MAG: hypothetical protein M3R17_12575 [Bacteroidota bacterium]|nr:hypothetical protein [Bacteroidota bacterium]
MFESQNFSWITKIYPFEWVMLGIYMLFIIAISFYVQVSHIKKEKIYRYYSWAVLAKVFSAVVFCLIYIYYYEGGDTVSYYETSRALVNLGMKNPGYFMREIFQSPSMTNLLLFDQETGYPWGYMYFDSGSWFVAKLLSPFLFVAFKSYLVSTVVLSWFSFIGTWKLFKMLVRYYPKLEGRMAFSILFVPSVLFWGSGISKDTFTFAAVCWFIVGLDGVFISKIHRLRNVCILLISAFILISIKPYILICLLPGAFVWILYTRISKMSSKFLKVAAIPLIYVFSFAVGYGVLSLLGNRLGKFSIEKMLVTASVTQKDLKQDYYHGSSFDIGDFEPTIGGMMSKAPAAMTVGLFRPFVWEARNPVMLASGLENLLFLLMALGIGAGLLFNLKKFFRILMDNPFLIFLLSYSILFSLLVGLSTSNFGALVRFKIPFLPFFVCALLLMNYFLWFRKPEARKASAFDKKSFQRIT